MVLALNVQFLMAMLHLKKKKNMIVASMGVFFFLHVRYFKDQINQVLSCGYVTHNFSQLIFN